MNNIIFHKIRQTPQHLLVMLILLSFVPFNCATCFAFGTSVDKFTPVMHPDTTLRPNFSLKDVNGQTITISALKGKVVFINFWATWCQPCVQEMPSIHALRQSFNGNDSIVFLTIDVDAALPKSTAYMDDKGFHLPVYAATSAVPMELYYHSIPTSTILGKDGAIVWHYEGGKDYTSPEIRKILTDLLAEK